MAAKKKTIWKFVIGRDAELKLSSDATFLYAVFGQGGWVTWWELDPHADKSAIRRFQTFGTGWDIPGNAKWLATALDGSFVWHLYEVP